MKPRTIVTFLAILSAVIGLFFLVVGVAILGRLGSLVPAVLWLGIAGYLVSLQR